MSEVISHVVMLINYHLYHHFHWILSKFFSSPQWHGACMCAGPQFPQESSVEVVTGVREGLVWNLARIRESYWNLSRVGQWSSPSCKNCHGQQRMAQLPSTADTKNYLESDLTVSRFSHSSPHAQHPRQIEHPIVFNTGFDKPLPLPEILLFSSTP